MFLLVKIIETSVKGKDSFNIFGLPDKILDRGFIVTVNGIRDDRLNAFLKLEIK